MTKLKIPRPSAIAHYENYSDDIKIGLIRRTLSKIPETEKAVIAGRLTAMAAAIALTPLWFAISVIGALMVVLRVQKFVFKAIARELDGDVINLEFMHNSLTSAGFLRSCIFGALYVGLSLSEIPFAASAACFFAAGHAYLFATQNIVLPKSLAIGLAPIFVAVIIVVTLQISQTGNIALILAPGFFVFSTALIVNRMSLGALKLLDLHAQFENTALLSQSNLRELQKEAALRIDLELAAGVGSYEWHLQDDRHVWSPGAYKIYGRALEDGMPTVAEFVERIAEEDRKTFLDKMSRAKETGVSIAQEFSFLGYDGMLRHVKSRGEALVDEKGNTLGFRGMVIDQTVQKVAAQIISDNFEALKKEVTLREELEMTAGVGSYEWYFEDDRHVWSKGTFQIYGRNIEDGVSSTDEFVSRLTPEGHETIQRQLSLARNEGICDGSEYQFHGYDNVARHLKCYGNPLLDNEGNLIGMRGLVIDQTAQKAASERIAESQMLLNLALIQGKSGVFVNDLTNSKLQAFGAMDMVGIIPGEDFVLSEKTLFERLPSKDKAIVFGAMQEAEARGETVIVEHQMRSNDDGLLDIRLALTSEGKPSQGQGRVITISTDITEEVKRRNELKAALAEAKRLSRVKSEFLANMSHEIRTPLNGIIAVTGILTNTALDDKQKEMLKLVETSGETLCQILNDILDIARVESGKMEIANSIFNLQESLENACMLFASKASEKNVVLNSTFAPLANGNFIGDSVRIRQIVSNLLSNAVKFTKKGTVDFALNIETSLEGKQVCRIDVGDTGSGLRPEDIARLFDRFEQIDGSITRQHGGSGLGLSISRDLARLMGGDIEVKSEFGKGSIFTLTLPLVSADNKTIEPKASTNNAIMHDDAGHVISILGVDDNITNRKVMDMILAQTGVNLTLCENGQEAVDVCNQEKFDIILMDLQMPVLDGLSAIRLIREMEIRNAVTATPIVAVSANAMSHHIDEAIEAGADDFLAKPFTPTALLSMIEKAIDAKSRTSRKSPKKTAKKG